MSDKIILFDTPTKEPRRGWSPNSWKTRFLLNYKGLDYKTEWLEYPDIKPRLEKHVEPHPKGTQYTVPTILMPDGTYVMDSKKIADFLSAKYPEPALTIDTPELEKLRALLIPMHTSDEGLARIFLPAVPRAILGEAGREYWYRTRAVSIGKPVDELEKDVTLDQAWAATEPFLRDITKLLKQGGGPFFTGKSVSYVDFVWGSYFIWMRELGDETLDRFVKATGDAETSLNFFTSLSEWWKRNDH